MIGRNITNGLTLGAALAAMTIGTLPQMAMAKSARSSFSVGLIIEPTCPLNAAGNVSRKRVPTANRARRIARTVLAGQGATPASGYELEVRHYRTDTGKWEVLQIWADKADSADALTLLIDKCSGEVSRL